MKPATAPNLRLIQEGKAKPEPLRPYALHFARTLAQKHFDTTALSNSLKFKDSNQ